MSVDGLDLLVEALDEVHVLRVGHPSGAGQVIRAGQFPVPDERVRLMTLGEARGTRVQMADQDVVGSVGPSVRAPERVRVIGWRLVPAAPEGQDGHRVPVTGHSFSIAPVLALNSSIIPSQTGSTSRMPVQNDGLFRARNSSISTPCCSTQVK